MATQNLLVFSIVFACSIYALWVLMPVAARRFIAKRLLSLPLGSTFRTVFQRAASATTGCDCSGCDKVVGLQQKTAPQVVQFHTRRKD